MGTPLQGETETRRIFILSGRGVLHMPHKRPFELKIILHF